MSEWRDIETAPKDGTWIIIEGEMRGGDTSTAMIARWNPKHFKGLGTYEWEVFDHDEFSGPCDPRDPDPEKLFNWYSAGRVSQWMPMP